MSTHEAIVDVPPELAGQRLDKVAAQLFPDFSRTELTRWISAGSLRVDGVPAKPKVKLAGGERLELRAALEPREDWRSAEALPLNVLFEDDDVLVLDKPAGLVVHPGAGNASGTLVNALLHHRPALAALPRAGVVHRLDKDTSGVMVVAASPAAQRALTRQIAERAVHRCYVCLAEGRMVAGMNVDKPIGRDPHVRTRQAVRDDGKPAYTELRVLERLRAHTLVEAVLGTGRTHQIRVHMQSVGYPLVGDKRYGARGRVPPGAAPALIEALHGFGRQALHAWQLEFTHPVRETELLRFDAPLPDDFERLLTQLRDDVQANGQNRAR